MCAICPSCGYDIAKDEPIERAGIAMAPYGQVRFNGAEVRLSPCESAMLWALMKADRPLRRAVIADRVGYEGDMPDDLVAVLLAKVRAKQRPHGEPPIRTIHGRGVYIEG